MLHGLIADGFNLMFHILIQDSKYQSSMFPSVVLCMSALYLWDVWALRWPPGETKTAFEMDFGNVRHAEIAQQTPN